MLKTLSVVVAVAFLFGVIAYVFLVANQIKHDCPRRIRYAWMSLAGAAAWLIGPLVVKGWQDCIGWAAAAFAAAVLCVLIVERRGHKHVPWSKVLP